MINHFLPGEMVSLEKHPVTYLALTKVCIRKGIRHLNFASNLKEFTLCQRLLKETTGLELHVKVSLTVGRVFK